MKSGENKRRGKKAQGIIVGNRQGDLGYILFTLSGKTTTIQK